MLQCVVVLYQCNFKQSRTLQSLVQISKEQPHLTQYLSILVFDNSPIPVEDDIHPPNCGGFEYRHDASNGGLAAAYNVALSLATQAATEWLLLLDQDTEITATFLSCLYLELSCPPVHLVSAIVPRLAQNGKILSPQKVQTFCNCPVPVNACGLQIEPTTAFNSAACLRVSAVTAIGGFPTRYWLDYLDHIVFYRLHSAGTRVFVLDVTLSHRHSLQALETEMSLARHANLLGAEWSFIREKHQRGGILLHRLRLLKRMARQMVRLRDKSYARQTLRAIFA